MFLPIKNKLLLLSIFFLILTFSSQSQDLILAKSIIDTLTSKNMYGRGYIRSGHNLAANYIENSFSNYNLKKFKSSYFQTFTFNINTFPSEVKLEIDKKEIRLGTSYIVAPYSFAGKGKGKLYYLKDNLFSNDSLAQLFLKKKLKSKVLVFNESQHNALIDMGLEYVEKAYSAKALIKLQEKKLTASLATSQYSNPLFEVLKDSLPKGSKKA